MIPANGQKARRSRAPRRSPRQVELLHLRSRRRRRLRAHDLQDVRFLRHSCEQLAGAPASWAKRSSALARDQTPPGALHVPAQWRHRAKPGGDDSAARAGVDAATRFSSGSELQPHACSSHCAQVPDVRAQRCTKRRLGRVTDAVLFAAAPTARHDVAVVRVRYARERLMLDLVVQSTPSTQIRTRSSAEKSTVAVRQLRLTGSHPSTPRR
jgi:hypothetical protein